MNNVEIIFKDVNKKYLEEIINKMVGSDLKNVISSHFFDEEKNEDTTYQDIESLPRYFSNSNVCNIYLRELRIGMLIEEVLLLVNCDTTSADITINFCEKQFEKKSKLKLSLDIQRLVEYLFKVSELYEVNEIFIGYEPADDQDMKIIEILAAKIKKCNEGYFKSKLCEVFFEVIDWKIYN